MDLILLISAFLITILASLILRIIYSIYKRKEVSSEYTGKDVAQMILEANGLDDIDVGTVYGELTDYYNNQSKEIKLSEEIYDSSSIASVAVAAHECGHAIQYKEGYSPIKIRNKIAPVASFGNTVGYFAIVIGLSASITKLFFLGIILISFAILFQLITLPVEIDASRRGHNELLSLGIIEEREKNGVKIMLGAAAFTYIAGLISSILEILRLIYIFSGRDND